MQLRTLRDVDRTAALRLLADLLSLGLPAGAIDYPSAGVLSFMLTQVKKHKGRERFKP